MKKLISVFAACLFIAPLAYAAMYDQGAKQESAACCDCCTDCTCENCVCSVFECACDTGGAGACDVVCCVSAGCCAK